MKEKKGRRRAKKKKKDIGISGVAVSDTRARDKEKAPILNGAPGQFH